jgi:hypothetical protein
MSPKHRIFAPEFKKTVHELTKLNEIVMKMRILKIIVSVLIAALTALATSLGLNSCNVVRTVTNRSEYWQKGDTSIMIQTKTVESYDAKKNGL